MAGPLLSALLCLAPAQAADNTAADTARSTRDALRGALQLRDVRLNVHDSCHQAGADAADRTIGDYLAGLLGAMDKPSNTVQASCQPGDGKRQACTVWLKHRDDEERWAWGLQFELDARKRPLIRSVRCLGAG